ncbi:MAG: DUF4364 family protein [Clostridiales bacterium]|nr:DUF4364 family protein [Clostridiales bacterium]
MKNIEDKQDVKKLCILYLLYTINTQMSNSQLADFAVETGYMDYFALRDYLADMTEAGLLEETRLNNQTYYNITEEGETTLGIFKRAKLSEETCDRINFYISRNKKKIKAESEISANWFYDPDSSFIVKCGIYEGDATLMEVNVSVVDRDVAEHICHKWKESSSEIYAKFFNELSGDFAALRKCKDA